jgi:hypothetical protein
MTNETEQNKKISFNFKVDISTVILAVITLYLMLASHNKSIENVKKVEMLISKYETKLDRFISEDKQRMATYKNNLKNAMASLSKEEQALLTKVFELSNKN